jgi:hypothetical protein
LDRNTWLLTSNLQIKIKEKTGHPTRLPWSSLSTSRPRLTKTMMKAALRLQPYLVFEQCGEGFKQSPLNVKRKGLLHKSWAKFSEAVHILELSESAMYMKSHLERVCYLVSKQDLCSMLELIGSGVHHVYLSLFPCFGDYLCLVSVVASADRPWCLKEPCEPPLSGCAFPLRIIGPALSGLIGFGNYWMQGISFSFPFPLFW